MDGGNKEDWKIRNEEIRARADVANISEKIGEDKLIRLGHVERKTEEDVAPGTENMEDGSGWTPKDSKTDTEVE